MIGERYSGIMPDGTLRWLWGVHPILGALPQPLYSQRGSLDVLEAPMQSYSHQSPGGNPPARSAAPQTPTIASPGADSEPNTVMYASASSVHRETRVETASESEVDSHLRSLTKRTSIEELARSGKTRNLKTLSERDLKEWIKEALRKVITSTTSIGDIEREQLLAATRTELTAIMIARKADDHAQADDAQTLAELTAERDALAKRVSTAEAMGSGRVADLQSQLSHAIARRDSLAARVADFAARLASALAAPVADPRELSELRGQMGERDAQVAKIGITRDEAQRVAREVMARLTGVQERALAEQTVLTDRVANADRANADLDRRRGEAERRAIEAEAKVTAAAVRAATTAGLALTSEKREEAQRANSAAQLKDFAAARARLIEELAQARAATAAEQQQLAAALRAAGESRVAAEHRARQAAETLAAAERQLQRCPPQSSTASASSRVRAQSRTRASPWPVNVTAWPLRLRLPKWREAGPMAACARSWPNATQLDGWRLYRRSPLRRISRRRWQGPLPALASRLASCHPRRPWHHRRRSSAWQ